MLGSWRVSLDNALYCNMAIGVSTGVKWGVQRSLALSKWVYASVGTMLHRFIVLELRTFTGGL